MSLLCRSLVPQRGLPALFQGPSHQPILWFDRLILALGTPGFVGGALEVLPQLRPLLPALLARVLDGTQAEIDCCRRERLENLVCDQFVEAPRG